MTWVVMLCLIAATVATTVAAIEATNKYLRWYYAKYPDDEL